MKRRRPGDWGKRGSFTDHLGRSHQFHSLYERRRMQMLDMYDYEFVREPIRIPYVFESLARNYRPDLIVRWYADGRWWTRVEEVKPTIRSQDPVNLAKFAAALGYCERHGYIFAVVTEPYLLDRDPPPYRLPA